MMRLLFVDGSTWEVEYIGKHALDSSEEFRAERT